MYGIRQDDEELFVLSTEPAKSFEEAQQFVGGMVEVVRLANGETMLVNEEGLCLDLPKNEYGSALANQHIVGPVIVLQTPEEVKEILG